MIASLSHNARRAAGLLLIVLSPVIPVYAHDIHEDHDHQAETLPLSEWEKAQATLVGLELPGGLPPHFTVDFEVFGQMHSLLLEKDRVFGDQTEILIGNEQDGFAQVDHGADGSYRGIVVQFPGYSVDGWLEGGRFVATIHRPGRRPLEISPSVDFGKTGLHQLNFANELGDGERIMTDCDLLVPPEPAPQPLVIAPAPKAKLKPARKITVREFVVGVEIGSKTFIETYKRDRSKALAVARRIPGQLDSRLLVSNGIKTTLGKVIIRTSERSDPLAGKVTSNSVSSLNAFRDYWNTNTKEVGNSHDLAVYKVYYPPSGIAYVNSIGGKNKYALLCGKGADSWTRSVLIHEIGHSWGLLHSNDSGINYEPMPRNSMKGATSRGGKKTFASAMGSSRNEKIASGEAARIFNVLKSKSKFGKVISSPPKVAPFGFHDYVKLNGKNSITVDVVKNDYDANNEPLNCKVYDKVSFQGGKISLSIGTGPSGRNQITYKRPNGVKNKWDFFHYTVVDPTGRRSWGCVRVSL